MDTENDLDLLLAEIEVTWGLDHRRRLPGPELVIVAASADDLAAEVGADVPDELAARLLDRVGRAAPVDPAEPPAVAADCGALLAEAGFGTPMLSGGPSYLAIPPLMARVAEAPDVPVLRSDDAGARSVAWSRPDNWEPDEWHRLVTGTAGAPWAMVVRDGSVVSICHTARRSPAGAEAGTWTDPAFRGRGYAAATTVAWANQLAPACPRLYYSTSADNRSSRRVAQRLGLRPIGWLWKLTVPRNDRRPPTVHR